MKITNENTVRKLITVAGILQILYLFIFFYVILVQLYSPFYIIVYFNSLWVLYLITNLLGAEFHYLVGYVYIWGVFFLVFLLGFLWYIWREDPFAHRTGFIVTGIIGLLFTGFIPGTLVVIAGIISPRKTSKLEGA